MAAISTIDPNTERVGGGSCCGIQPSMSRRKGLRATFQFLEILAILRENRSSIKSCTTFYCKGDPMHVYTDLGNGDAHVPLDHQQIMAVFIDGAASEGLRVLAHQRDRIEEGHQRSI